MTYTNNFTISLLLDSFGVLQKISQKDRRILANYQPSVLELFRQTFHLNINMNAVYY